MPKNEKKKLENIKKHSEMKSSIKKSILFGHGTLKTKIIKVQKSRDVQKKLKMKK